MNQDKEFGQIRILSLDGSRLYKCGEEGYPIRNKNGKIDFSKFEGYLDESLETIQLEKVYNRHKKQLGEFKEGFFFYPRSSQNGSPFSLALINVAFDYTIKNYSMVKTKFGQLFIQEGHEYNEVKEHLCDHIWVDDENGSSDIIAIEVPYPQGSKSKNDNFAKYGSVEEPVSDGVLGHFFAYDEEHKCYCRAKVYDKKKDKEIDKPFVSLTASYEIRNELYKNGFMCDGIHYVRYKRSAGSSRDGQCLFIPETLYAEMMEWSSCGIDGKNVEDQASFQAYISLTLSSIKKTIRLNKKNILIIPDQESKFKTNAIRVFRNENNGLNTEYGEVEINNKIWDGEALLDESVFCENDDGENNLSQKGMMLLRNRFFKTCAFNTKLQKWFTDNGITDIKQLNGCYRRGAKLSDIKMVITESSLKYCKMLPNMDLQAIFDKWIDHTFEGNYSEFGLVKTDKPTNIMGGKMVRTNYQLLNTIGLSNNEVADLLSDSFKLLRLMMNDPMYLRYYIQLSVNADEDEEEIDATTVNYRSKAATEMLKRSDDFVNTKYYCDFRGDILDSFKKKIKKGKVPIDGTNATIFGNGAEFLRAVIDEKYEVEEPLALKGNEIRTTQFGYGKDLLCARNPHITMGNLFLAKNVDNDVYKNYFNFENAHEIVCINAIQNNIQQRLNGCDYDSDFMLVTENKILIDATRRNEPHFPVPVADFDPKNDTSNETYRFENPLDLAKLDRAIAENKIGDIVNLSQFLNSMYWDFVDKGCSHEELKDLYADICKLAVLSGIEIDKAKRSNKVKAGTVLAQLQKRKTDFKQTKIDGKEQGLPTFYTFITDAGAKRTKAKLNAPMSLIFDAVEKESKENHCYKVNKCTDLGDLLVPLANGGNDSHRKKAIINKANEVQDKLSYSNLRMRGMSRSEKLFQREMMDKSFGEMQKTVANNLANEHVLKMLIKELDAKTEKVSSCYSLLVASLVLAENRMLIDHLNPTAKPQFNLIYDPTAQEGAVFIYGYPHKKEII